MLWMMPLAILLLCNCFEVWNDRYWMPSCVFKRGLRSDLWCENEFGLLWIMICEALTRPTSRQHYRQRCTWCIRWRKCEGWVCKMATFWVLVTSFQKVRDEIICFTILLCLNLCTAAQFDISHHLQPFYDRRWISRSNSMLSANCSRISHAGWAISLHIFLHKKWLQIDLAIEIRNLQDNLTCTYTTINHRFSKRRSKHYWWWWTLIDVPNNIGSIHPSNS
jgi:hypothetical protein